MNRAASAVPESSPIERELAALVAEVLNLDTAPDTLDPVAPLFGDQGLGLDSIDILEMAVAISKRYGFQIRSDDPDNERIFASLRALASHVAEHRTK
jgi:acyl carrier protein